MNIVAPQVFPLQLGLAIRRITLLLTRDGEQSSSPKLVRMLNPADLSLQGVFLARNGYSESQTFLAAAVDREWLLVVVDETPPRRAAARYPAISEDVTLSIDLNDGTGGGAAGSPATLAARVRVDGVDAAREVLAVERQTDGVWRIAGNLRTAEGDLDLRVTGGEVYALALDDYGTAYQPNLEVAADQTIRPTAYAGWLYRITEAGTLPATEPEWWPIAGDNAPRDLGTARAVAVRYYRPLAHGPVPVEMV